MFAGNVEAYHDIWVVGDLFLKETADALFGLRRSASAANKPANIHYLFKYFNVSTHHNTSGISNVVNRFLNAFVEPLNTRAKLAKYIVIVPDVDIVSKFSEENGQSIMMGAVLHKIIKQMDTCIQCRRTDLLDKKPGTLIDDEYPKLIWV